MTFNKEELVILYWAMQEYAKRVTSVTDAEYVQRIHALTEKLSLDPIYPKCRFCGMTRFPVDRIGHCEACNEGMARTNGD